MYRKLNTITGHNNRLVPRPLLIILSTDLPMYSPANKQPHLVHVKHHKCHCLSRAKSDCPLRISSPHPAHPTDRQSYILDKYQNNGKWILTVGDKLWAVKSRLKSFRDALSSAVMDSTEWPIQLHNSYDVYKLIKSTGELTNLLVIKKRTSPKGVEVVSQQ